MALTPYYGLSFFGGNTPGALTDDGAKFTGADRLLLDRMLHALATSHRHLREYQSISDPGTPTAVIDDDGGLPAGATYYYVVTYIDEDGLESLPSEEVQVTTPVALAPPDAPTLTDEDSGGTPFGGALTPGLYFYALTAVNGVEESILGPQVSITLVDAGSSVQVTLPAAPAGAPEAQLWRLAANDVGWTRVGTTAFTLGGTFLDNGSVPANLNAADPTQAPPATNSGQDIYSVNVTLAVPDHVLATELSAWRLYRTETSGAWPAASLVQQVVDRTVEGDLSSPLVVSWKDDGDVLLDGLPPTTSQGVQLTPYVFDNVNALPLYTGYPLWYPVIYGGALYVRGPSGWLPLSGGGGSGTVQIFQQDVPSASWLIPHSFPYPPAVSVTDSLGREVLVEVAHNPGQVVVMAAYAFAGTAHLS